MAFLMMLFPSLLLALLFFVAESAVTVCPKRGSIAEGVKYHHDGQCDRAAYNQFKADLGRHAKQRAYQRVGGVRTVPNEKTVTCPAGGVRVNMKDEHTPNIGHDVVWFVENRASSPVVVSFVNANGVEVSARNPKISPAIADPSAHLKPNAWMAVYAFEGHEFVVREVLKSGMAGNVLLQHRAGLIPVGVNTVHLTCPDEDLEPMVVDEDDEEVLSPVFQRTPTKVHRPCNTMDVGFRNTAACPLHGYYVTGEGNSCQEEFKFHLGVAAETFDYIHDWESQTKYEGSFIGHTFHFRLASNHAVLVDTITLQPTIVTDCPVSSAAAIAVEHEHVGIMAPIQGAEWFNSTQLSDMEFPESFSNSTMGITFGKPVARTI
jgi:hypothetical protein